MIRQSGYPKSSSKRRGPLAFLLPVSLLILAILAAADAGAAIVIGSGEVYPVRGADVEILEDPGAALTIADIASPRFARAFAPSRDSIPNYGLSKSAYWFRFTVDGRLRGNTQWVLFLDQPIMDEVDLYTPRDDGAFQVTSSGDVRPMSIREIRGRDIALPLPVRPYATTYYLRTWIPGRAQFPLSLMTRDAFQRKAAMDQSLFAACAGFMVAMAIVGLAIFAHVRDRSYLYFGLYIASSLLALAGFTGYYYAWGAPGNPVAYHGFLLVFFILMILMGLLFTRTFLRLHETAPFLDKALKGLTGFALLLIPVSLLLAPLIMKGILNVTYLAATIGAMVAAVAAYRKGFAPARYFLFSRVSIYLGALAITLINFNLLPVELLSGNLLLILPVLDAGFMALALADRVQMQTRQISGLIQDLRREIQERVEAHREREVEMEARLQLEREVVRVSDEERIRISRDLHDGLCQQLTGARLLCAALEGRVTEDGAALSVLAPLKRLLTEAGEHAHDLSRGAWPMENDPQGQRSSLEELTAHMSEQSGVPIGYSGSFHCPTCANGHLTQIYRIAQEALVNAVKHSRAGRISVRLTCAREQGVRLEVADDGVGRSGQWQTSPDGMGMRIMAHRARMIGGTLEIGDSSGGGTTVVCTAPCTLYQERELP